MDSQSFFNIALGLAAADMPALEAVMGNITWPHDPDYVAQGQI
jgi:hypothetical protein